MGGRERGELLREREMRERKGGMGRERGMGARKREREREGGGGREREMDGRERGGERERGG